MIIDKQMELSNAQAVTATAASVNVLDLGPNGPAGNSVGEEGKLPLQFTVDTTFTAGGAATMTIQLRSSAAANMAGAVVHEQSNAIPVASLVAGARFPWSPSIPFDANRYIDVNYVIATGPMTAGAISCRGIASRQSNK